MADFRLSQRAERDLIEIYDYTEETFGAYQADAYHAGLEHTFDLLADFPLIGRSVDELIPGIRRFRFQAHTVFYTQEADFILIRAVLHQAREIRPDLFDLGEGSRTLVHHDMRSKSCSLGDGEAGVFTIHSHYRQ